MLTHRSREDEIATSSNKKMQPRGWDCISKLIDFCFAILVAVQGLACPTGEAEQGAA